MFYFQKIILRTQGMSMVNCRSAFVFLMLVTATEICAQDQIGLNPPSLQWQQISTPAGRIIFPTGLDTMAFHVARLMNYQRSRDQSITGFRQTQRVPVILQNQSTLPAGFSTPAPWRNEYYLTPPQNMFLGPIKWVYAMPIHEYRHTQQFSMANQGFTWLYKVLMGQTGWLLNSLMTQPLWFREGDAVVAETIFTKGGRGRLPSFHMEYRAMRIAGYHYDYEKAHYNSFRDFVPNPYRTGYYMVTRARREFGETIWANVLTDTYRRKGLFYPFSRGLREHTNWSTKELYNQTVQELDRLWNQTNDVLEPTQSQSVNARENQKYTSYRFPHYLPNGDVVTLKSGLDLINTYYVISDAKESKLFSPGIYTDDHITTVMEGNIMTWAESAFHERWRNVDYSIIRSHDFKTGQTIKLTSRTRYFSPAPSKAGDRIIVSETDTHNTFSLVVLDAKTGEEIKRLPNPDNVFFTHMRWEDEHFVVAVILNEKGNALARIDTRTGSIEKLMRESSVPLSRPFVSGQYVFFSAGHEGINNIFALNRSDNKIYQVTRVRFGAFEPVISANGQKMIYSEYTAGGYSIKEMNLTPESWPEAGFTDSDDAPFHMLEQHEVIDLDDPDSLVSYPVKKYRALTSGLFNFYGWTPLPNIPEYGLELYTRNLMSTLIGTVGFAYNTNEDRLRYYTRLTYAALYPHFDLTVNSGSRRTAKLLEQGSPQHYFEQDWRENSLSAGVRFPFRLTRGTHYTQLDVAGLYTYHDVSFLDSTDLTLESTRLDFQGYRAELQFVRNRVQARQHVKPRWGQEVSVAYDKAIDSTPEKLHATSVLYFPGVHRTHSLNFRLAFKREEVVDTYRYIDDFIMPRGYEPMPFDDVRLVGANYEFPVWYPDLAAGPAAFFQRFRTNLFVDHAAGITGNLTQKLTSLGGELFIDLRLFRLFQMTVAFRYSHAFDDPLAGTVPFQFLITRFELVN